MTGQQVMPDHKKQHTSHIQNYPFDDVLVVDQKSGKSLQRGKYYVAEQIENHSLLLQGQRRKLEGLAGI